MSVFPYINRYECNDISASKAKNSKTGLYDLTLDTATVSPMGRFGNCFTTPSGSFTVNNSVSSLSILNGSYTDMATYPCFYISFWFKTDTNRNAFNSTNELYCEHFNGYISIKENGNCAYSGPSSNSSSSTLIGPAAKIFDGTWHFVLFGFQNSNTSANLWVDGVQKISATSIGTINQNNFNIFTIFCNIDKYYIDELRFFKTTSHLTAAQVATQMNEPIYVSRYEFEDLAGETTRNSVTNDYDLTLLTSNWASVLGKFGKGLSVISNNYAFTYPSGTSSYLYSWYSTNTTFNCYYFSFWFRTNTNKSTTPTTNTLTVDHFGGYISMLNNNTCRYTGPSALKTATSVPTIFDGLWHLVTFGFNNNDGTANIWVDNSQVLSATTSLGTFLNGNYTFDIYSAVDRYYVDDLRLYKRYTHMTQSDVSAVYFEVGAGPRPTISSITPLLNAFSLVVNNYLGGTPAVTAYQASYSSTFATIDGTSSTTTISLSAPLKQAYTVYIRTISSTDWASASPYNSITSTPHYAAVLSLTVTPNVSVLKSLDVTVGGTAGNPSSPVTYSYAVDNISGTYTDVGSATFSITNLSNTSHTIYVKANSGTTWTASTVNATATAYYAGTTTISVTANVAAPINSLDVVLGTGTAGNPSTPVTFSYVVDDVAGTYTDAASTSFRIEGLSAGSHTVYAKSRSGTTWTSEVVSASATPYSSFPATAPTLNSATVTLSSGYQATFTEAATLLQSGLVGPNFAVAASDHSTTGRQLVFFANENGLLHMTVDSGVPSAVQFTTYSVSEVTPDSPKLMAVAVSGNKSRTVIAAGAFLQTTHKVYWANSSDFPNTSLSFYPILDTNSAGYSFTGLAMTQNGLRLIAATAFGNGILVSAWNGSNYGMFTRTLDPTGDSLWGITVSSDGSKIAYTSNAGEFYWAVWNGTTYGTPTAAAYNAGNAGRSIAFVEGKPYAVVLIPYGGTNTLMTWDGTNFSNATAISTTYVPSQSSIGWGLCIDNSGYLFNLQYASDTLYRSRVVSSRTPSSASVTFTAGTEGSPATTGYWYALDGCSNLINTGSLTSPFTVNELSVGTHTLTLLANSVSAGNTLWTSPTSNTLSFAVNAPGTAPTAASVVSNLHSFAVTVNPSTDGYPNPTNYVFAFDASFADVQANIIAPNVTASFTGLTANTYTVYMKAISTDIWTSDTATTPATPYYAGNVFLSAALPGSYALNTLNLTFDTPIVGNPAPDVFYYSIDGGSTYANTTANTVSVGDVPSTSCNVVAYSSANTIWDSSLSNTVSITPYFIGTDPSIVSVDVGYQALTVNFNLSSGGNPTATTYYCALDNGAGGPGSYVYSNTASPIFFTGVTGASRTVYLRAAGEETSNTVWTSNVSSTTVQLIIPGSKPTFSGIVPSLNSLALSWNFSQNGFPDTTNYVIATDSNFTSVLANVDGSTNTTVISSLANQQYTLYLKAISDDLWSSPYDSSDATPYYKASDPTWLSNLPDINSISVSYTASTGGNPTASAHYYAVDNSSNWIITPSTSFVISSLSGGAHTFYLESVGNVDLSTTIWTSNVDSFSANVYAVGSAPTIDSVASNALNSLTVAFSPSTGGFPDVSGYQYSITDTQPSSFINVPLPLVNGNSFVLTGLTNPSYDVYMRALSVDGIWTSNISSPATGTPFLTPTGAPTNLSAASANNSVVVYFTPETGGYPAASYYYYTVDGGQNFSNSSAPSSPVLVDGLFSPNPVTIQIKAVFFLNGDTIWESPLSTPISGTPYVTPTTGPTITQIDSSTNRLIVNFTGEIGGNPPATAYLYSIDGQASFVNTNTPTSPVIISGLNTVGNRTVFLKAVYDDASANRIWEILSTNSLQGQPYIQPLTAPVISAQSAYESLSVSFTAPVGGYPPPNQYLYQLNGTGPFLDTGSLTSPFTIPNLFTPTSQSVVLRAQFTDSSNQISWTTTSASSSATPYIMPSNAPFIQSVTSVANGVNFVLSDGSGGYPTGSLLSYYYSIDNGNTYSLFTTIDSTNDPTKSGFVPFTVADPSGYPLRIKSAYIDANSTQWWLSSESNMRLAYPYIAGAPPVIGSIVGGVSKLIVPFTPPVGAYPAPTTYFYSLDNVTYTNANTTTSPIEVPTPPNPVTYAVYLIAQNAAGNTLPSSPGYGTPLVIGADPVVDLVTATVLNQLNVFFTLGTGGSTPTTIFVSSDAGNTFVNANTTTSPYVITGANIAKLYGVQIIAQSAAGNTNPSNTVYKMPLVIGSPPVITGITPDINQLSVAFTGTTDGNPAPTSYYYTLNGSAQNIDGQTATSPLIISNLLTASPYVVRLRAYNSNGFTELSDPSSATPYVIGNPPVISAVDSSAQSLVVTFSAPTNANPEPSTYYYSIDNEATYVNMNTTTSPFTIAGLTVSNAYTVKLKAYNATVGNTEPYTFGAAVRPFNVGTTPNISSIQTGLNTFTVNFSASTNGNPTPYIFYSTDAGNTFANSLATSSPFTISTGLTEPRAYGVVLKAVNDIGNSSPSSPAVYAIPLVIGSAPNIRAVNSQLNSISIDFDVSTGGYPNPSTYYYSLDGGNTFTNALTTTSPIVVGNLFSVATYTVVLKAQYDGGNTANSNSVLGAPYVIGSNISILQVDSSFQSLVVSFIPSTGGNPTNPDKYYYSLDDGATFVDAGAITSPYQITPLTTVQSYQVQLKAHYAGGNSNVAVGPAQTPYIVGSVPTILPPITSLKNAMSVDFTPSSGGYPSPYVFYSIDGGNTYANSFANSSPIVITDVSNLTPYLVNLKAVYIAGNTAASANVAGQPWVVPSPPVIGSVDSSNAAVVIRFTQPTDGYPAPTNYFYSTDGVNFLDGQTATSPLIVRGYLSHAVYNYRIFAVTEGGNTAVSNTVSGEPWIIGSVPLILQLDPSLQALVVRFSPSVNGFPTPPNYYYSVDSGAYQLASNVDYSGNSFTIGGLTVTKSYSVRIFASNSAGNTNASPAANGIPYAVGNKPVITTLTSALRSVVVEYAPAVGGNPPPAYFFSVDGGSWVSVLPTQISSTQFIVPNLTLPQSYSIQVIASSTAGNLVSDASYATPWIIGTAPNISQVDSSFQRLVVTFSPSTGGYPTTPNAYYYSIDGGSTYTNTGSLSTTFSISPLLTAGTYSVTMLAAYAGGNTEASNAVTGQPFIIGSPPVIVSANSLSQSLSISFQGTTDGYPAPDTYYYTLDNGNTFVNANTTTSPFTIGNLFTAVSRTVRLQAHNSQGNTALSTGVSATPLIVGTAPNISSITSQLNQLTVNFDLSTGGNPPPISYFYSVNGGASYANAQTTSSPIVITGLNVLQDYEVSLFAQYSSGNTLVSNTVTARPLTVGSAPVITSANSASQSIVVNFTPTLGANPFPTTYYYSIDGGASFVNGNTTTSPLIIAGFTAPTTANIQIFANSTVGNTAVSNAVTGQPWIIGTAPNISRVDSAFEGVTVFFRASLNGYPEPFTYYYSTNGGNTFTSTNGPITSPYTITGLNSAGIFPIVLRAENLAGNTEVSNSATGRPNVIGSPPFITSITSALNSILVNFLESPGGYPPVTTYYYSVNGGAYVNAARTLSPITITGLTTLGVRTVNMFGLSQTGNTNVSNTASGEPWIVGSAPQITSITPLLNALSVQFTVSSGGNPPVDTYFYSINSGNTFVNLQSTANTFVIGNLNTATSLGITLRGYNASVGNTASATVQFAAPLIIGSVPIVRAVTSTLNGLLVDFSGSVGGNPAPSSYLYTLDGGTTFVDLSNGSSTASFAIGNLTTVGSRSVQMIARNAGGNTALSAAVAGAPFVLGSAPTISRIDSSYQSVSVFLDSTEPYNGFPNLSTYFYSVDNGNTFINAQTLQSPIVIYDLFLPTAYNIVVKGSNFVGNTNVSNMVQGFPYILGSAPTLVSVTPGVESLTFEIAAPTDGYPAPYTYKYSTDNVNYVSLGSSSTTIQFTGLSVLQQYTYYLVAVNLAGTTQPLIVRGTPYKVGQAPAIGPNVVAAPNTITFDIVPSTGGNPAPERYFFSIDGGVGYTEVSANELTGITVTDLVPATYSLKTTALSSIWGYTGVSSATVSVDVVGLGSVPNITGISSIQNGLVVHFTPSVGGFPAPFTYFYSVDSGPFVDGLITQSPLVITGLNTIKEYSVQLFAASNIGNTAPSTMAYATPFLVGGPPSITSITVDNSSAVMTVNFLESGGNPPPVRYEYSFDGGNTFIDGQTAHSPILIQNINIYIVYNVTLRAVYVSPPSSSFNWTTTLVEGPPTIFSVDIGFDMATVALERNDGVNFPAIDSWYYSIDGGATFVRAATNQSPLVISPLQDSSRYTIYIKLRNVYGLYSDTAQIEVVTRSLCSFLTDCMNPRYRRNKPIIVGPLPKFTDLPGGINATSVSTSEKFSEYVNGPHATRR